jgi:hypothetical protein
MAKVKKCPNCSGTNTERLLSASDSFLLSRFIQLLFGFVGFTLLGGHKNITVWKCRKCHFEWEDPPERTQGD